MDATQRAPSVLSGPPTRVTSSATTLAAALFLALPLTLTLGGCGQKGPLRLPEATTPDAKKTSAVPVPGPSTAAPVGPAAQGGALGHGPDVAAQPTSPTVLAAALSVTAHESRR